MANTTNYDEALTAQAEGKETVKQAKTALKAYLSENKLSKTEDHSEDPKHGKKIKRLTSAVEKAQKAMETLNADVKELKPKKERASKYEYPEGLSAAEKKKFRAKQRAEANREKKKAEKGESAGNADKKGKKTSKKKKTAKVEAEDED